MAKLSDSQIRQIYALKDTGKSIRDIVSEMSGIVTKSQIETLLNKRTDSHQQQTIAALVQKPVAQQAVQSVFDIAAGLQMCLVRTQELMSVEYEKTDDPENPISEVKLRDRVAVRSELRQLFAEARKTLESVYNIKMLDEFIREVTTILEEQAPGARQRIFERLEQNAAASGAIGIFSNFSKR